MTGVRNLYAQRLAKRGFVSEPFQWLAGWYGSTSRRFTWLVDVFYDDRVKMIVAAEAQPDALFAGGGEAKTAAVEFARTASRLTEMQTAEYLQAEHRRESGTSGEIQGIPA